MKTIIGIDNGVTGSIAILTGEKTFYYKTPVSLVQDYTKTKKNINRIDFIKMLNCFKMHSSSSIIAIIERPMVNPGRFQATASALRSLEATLICLEMIGIPYQFIDSKEWQKEMLPAGLKKEELKKASMDIGIRLFPDCKEGIMKQKDADSLLIAEYSRRKNF